MGANSMPVATPVDVMLVQRIGDCNGHSSCLAIERCVGREKCVPGNSRSEDKCCDEVRASDWQIDHVCGLVIGCSDDQAKPSLSFQLPKRTGPIFDMEGLDNLSIFERVDVD